MSNADIYHEMIIDYSRNPINFRYIAYKLSVVSIYQDEFDQKLLLVKFWLNHFPIQNLEKMLSNKSSDDISPVISPR